MHVCIFTFKTDRQSRYKLRLLFKKKTRKKTIQTLRKNQLCFGEYFELYS